MTDEDGPHVVGVRAPAKLNLQLSVGERADDGFHPLATVFMAISLWETVFATPRDDGEFTITVDARPPIRAEGVPLDETNLAVRAARAVAKRYGVTAGVDLRIVKGVPVAGGLAGGSADAAAALVACAEAWGVGATRSELFKLAARLGSDVPFCLHGHTAIGLGRGDILTPAMTQGVYHWVLATQAEGLSTAAVYAEFDRAIEAGEDDPSDLEVSESVMVGLRNGDIDMLGDSLTNGLQQAAFQLRPVLRDVHVHAMGEDVPGVVLCGSGPTTAILARSRQHALVVAASLKESRLVDATLIATGPVPGATIVSLDDEG